MSDSMTKDDVLYALGEISQHFENCTKATYGGSHERFHRWMNAADWAAAYLNDPAPTIGGWISVKDRLPENEEYVILWTKTGVMMYAKYLDDEPHRPWITYGENGSIRAWDNVVAYWMPLPTPPEGGDRE